MVPAPVPDDFYFTREYGKKKAPGRPKLPATTTALDLADENLQRCANTGANNAATTVLAWHGGHLPPGWTWNDWEQEIALWRHVNFERGCRRYQVDPLTKPTTFITDCVEDGVRRDLYRATKAAYQQAFTVPLKPTLRVPSRPSYGLRPSLGARRIRHYCGAKAWLRVHVSGKAA